MFLQAKQAYEEAVRTSEEVVNVGNMGSLSWHSDASNGGGVELIRGTRPDEDHYQGSFF